MVMVLMVYLYIFLSFFLSHECLCYRLFAKQRSVIEKEYAQVGTCTVNTVLILL